MSRPDEQDIIGTRPPRDQTAGLDLFEQRSVPDAEAEIRRDFQHAEPAADSVPSEPPAVATPLSPEERERAKERIKATVLPRLLTRAYLLLDVPQDPGVTADDVQEIAERMHLSHLLGREQRAWSWVGTWLPQLAREGKLVLYEIMPGQAFRRRSKRPDAHGNALTVYLHPDDHRARRVA